MSRARARKQKLAILRQKLNQTIRQESELPVFSEIELEGTGRKRAIQSDAECVPGTYVRAAATFVVETVIFSVTFLLMS